MGAVATLVNFETNQNLVKYSKGPGGTARRCGRTSPLPPGMPSLQDKALLVNYFNCDSESATEALRAFRYFKGIRSGKGPMSCYSLKRLIKSFEETGSLETKPRSGRPSTCKSVAVTVLQNAEAIETLSTYGELKVSDFEKRQEFAAWVFRQIDIDGNWLSNVLRTDDAHFYLKGEFNIQNCLILATETPRNFTEIPLHQHRVTVLYTDTVITGTQQAVSGKSLDVYLSIPYAQPPTGERRFKDPEPITNLPPHINATHFPPSCCQKDFRPQEHSNKTMNEDCLYLNIWAPSQNSQMAVLVFIPGGAFEFGSSDLYFNNPQYLAARTDMIIVTVNFRVGALGFLDLNMEGSNGNFGLKDQILALKWIQKNIKVFGGDPDKVTLYGFSSGAISIGFHLSREDNRYLFKRAILQSGTSNSGYFIPKSGKEKALEKFYQSLNCSQNSHETLDCLQTMSKEKIIYAEDQAFKVDLLGTFRPSLDNRYIPFTSILNFNETNIPLNKDIMIGITKDEASFIIPLIKDIYEFIPKKYMAIQIIKQFIGLNDSDEFTRIANSYFKDVTEYKFDQYNIAFKELLGDLWFRCPTFYFSNIMASRYNNVFFYYFTYQSTYKAENETTKDLGALHGEDFQYSLGLPQRDSIQYTEREIEFSNKMMDYIGNFSKYGQSNNPEKEFGSPLPSGLKGAECPRRSKFKFADVSPPLLENAYSESRQDSTRGYQTSTYYRESTGSPSQISRQQLFITSKPAGFYKRLPDLNLLQRVDRITTTKMTTTKRQSNNPEKEFGSPLPSGLKGAECPRRSKFKFADVSPPSSRMAYLPERPDLVDIDFLLVAAFENTKDITIRSVVNVRHLEITLVPSGFYDRVPNAKSSTRPTRPTCHSDLSKRSSSYKTSMHMQAVMSNLGADRITPRFSIRVGPRLCGIKRILTCGCMVFSVDDIVIFIKDDAELDLVWLSTSKKAASSGVVPGSIGQIFLWEYVQIADRLSATRSLLRNIFVFQGSHLMRKLERAIKSGLPSPAAYRWWVGVARLARSIQTQLSQEQADCQWEVTRRLPLHPLRPASHRRGRFKDPEPIINLPRYIKATQFPPSCWQKNFRLEEHANNTMNEDCLYLNIWAPSQNAQMAVLVFIHGGAFEYGSSDELFNNPQYLSARTDMVIVTVNYRVGSLGFLDLNMEGSNGNFGLKDQILALKWIQKNIKVFGGDPDKVTLYGISAGAMAIGLHLSREDNRYLLKEQSYKVGLQIQDLLSQKLTSPGNETTAIGESNISQQGNQAKAPSIGGGAFFYSYSAVHLPAATTVRSGLACLSQPGHFSPKANPMALQACYHRPLCSGKPHDVLNLHISYTPEERCRQLRTTLALVCEKGALILGDWNIFEESTKDLASVQLRLRTPRDITIRSVVNVRHLEITLVPSGFYDRVPNAKSSTRPTRPTCHSILSKRSSSYKTSMHMQAVMSNLGADRM
ncbi:BCHE [Cordylochernes scorpioides]|uniref:BCHE n=1 Tax=Cordylochernes scorpioides TaxID=51811 RepID=A0ABY6LC92_9ARAC|nr:BCHE [Cordylochernes scorpioides]